MCHAPRFPGGSRSSSFSPRIRRRLRGAQCSRRIWIGALLAELDDALLSQARRAEIEAALAAEITMLWQPDEVRSQRPRVVDEIRHGLWFFEQSLIDSAERLLADY